MRHLVAVFTIALVLASGGPARAQACPGSSTLFKNDDLPQFPPGAATVSVILGLCEGEAAGCIFDVSALGSSATILKAAVGFANVAGATGIQAEANVVIHDGISWAGQVPVLGPAVFDFNQVTGASVPDLGRHQRGGPQRVQRDRDLGYGRGRVVRPEQPARRELHHGLPDEPHHGLRREPGLLPGQEEPTASDAVASVRRAILAPWSQPHENPDLPGGPCDVEMTVDTQIETRLRAKAEVE